jgi:hypothetical protein
VSAAHPDGVALGSAIFALIEPHRGREREFNRWYERDHLYAAGAMAPWTLSAARFVAPRALKALRIPRPSPLVDPPEAGSYLSAFWIQDGQLDEQQRWVQREMEGLAAQGRLFPAREHVCTHRYAYRGGAFRDPDGVPAELALDRRYPGVVCAWLERSPGATLEALEAFALEELAPPRLRGSPVAMALAFALLPKPEWWPEAAPQPPGLGERLLLVLFVECDPRRCWDERFGDLDRALEASGRGRLLLAAPFLATVPGTDTYVDELF